MNLTKEQIDGVLEAVIEKYGDRVARYAQNEAAKSDGTDEVKRRQWLQVLDAVREIERRKVDA